ncbi:CotH kinase family protein [Ruminococcus flavefaciens]|uniref:CotH protein n=1 Tax=Ruminococcus flavefaciens TaxID=1265 RepID=A0A1M7G7X5_RUMFL|nr:CotH kinase family protein [Ruminococcus flavefaciens]SHM12235.1 CotH protein [Ruminococcus flavefaciens]
MNIKTVLSSAISSLIAGVCLSTSISQAFAAGDLSFSRDIDIIDTQINITAEAEEEENLIYKELPISSFIVSDLSPQTDSLFDRTNWSYSKWEDCHYIFLPATADRTKLIIDYNSDEGTIYLDDEELVSGEYTDILSRKDEFQIKTAKGTDCGKLKIMQSDRGSIYIDTNGFCGFSKLFANRFIDFPAYSLMLDAEGNIVYEGEIKKVSSHGNSSWDYSKKKPYNIKLPKKADLFGMGKAKKWVLLSNYLDHSMLRNKLTEEMCKAAGMECTMDTVFADLYTDGEYSGTYQLCEKVQVQKNRVNITDLEEETEKVNEQELSSYERRIVGAEKADEYMENSYKYFDIPNDPEDITGGYLLQLVQWNRYGLKATSGFTTSRGQCVSIEGPEYASKAQAEYIRGFVQDMEDAIYSDTGYNSKGKHYTEYIDLDSVARAYLVQEISMNIDATYNSFYFWKDSDLKGDGKLHFSPMWDFDLSYNNFITSRTNSDGNTGWSSLYNNLFAAYFPIHGSKLTIPESGRPAAGISWLGQLYKCKDFHCRTADIYFKDFEPFLKKLTGGDSPYLTEMGKELSASAEMNNMLWHTYGGAKYCVFGSSSGATYLESVDIVRQFIEKRTNWLSSLWKNDRSSLGDINYDGEINVSDLLALQKWLMGSGRTVYLENADENSDGVVDVFDLCQLRSHLLNAGGDK